MDTAKALADVDAVKSILTWHDEIQGTQIADPASLGDVVLDQKQTPASYHLAATLDDEADGITHVVRGMDLFSSTHIHRLLQALLGLPTPQYVHHRLLWDEEGRKLSKSKGSLALGEMRKAGADGPQLLADLRASKLPVGITLSHP